jgi:hypothetical protein
VGTLTKRLYEIWLEEGTDLFDGRDWPESGYAAATDRARRAARIFDERTGETIRSYHVGLCYAEIDRQKAKWTTHQETLTSKMM